MRHAIASLINAALSRVGLRLIRLENAPPGRINPSGAHEKNRDNPLLVDVPFAMIVPSIYGPVIVNRYDINQTTALIKTGRAFDHAAIELLCGFLASAAEGAVCLDVGANYGLFGLAFARALRRVQGVCHAFEAQRIIASMASGTAVLNSVQNLIVHNVAVGDRSGAIPVPGFDYERELNFGSIEFGGQQREKLSQDRIYTPFPELVRLVRLDDFGFTNVHIVKIDVEGMENLVLEGARELIEREKPVISIEWLKSDRTSLVRQLKGFGYRVYEWGHDFLCIHEARVGAYPMEVALSEL